MSQFAHLWPDVMCNVISPTGWIGWILPSHRTDDEASVYYGRLSLSTAVYREHLLAS